MSDHEDTDLLAQRLRTQLDQGAASLDEATCERLRQARQAALSGATPAANRHSGRWAGGVAVAAAIVLTLSVWRPTAQIEHSETFEEAVLFSATEDLEFYEELEFYQWLASDGPEA